MKSLFLILILFCFSFVRGQSIAQIELLDSLTNYSKLDSLKSNFSRNKTTMPEHELVSFLSLSYYPELIDTKIIFKKAKIKTTLNVRPSVSSLLFRSKKNRTYIVRINNKLKDSIINFNTIPFNAKAGLLGHEYSHILDYKDKNIFQIIKRLVAYSTKKTKSNYEKEIDIMAINKGLGWQLYAWSKYVLQESNAKNNYKKFKQETYLTPDQINGFMIKQP